MCTPVLDVGNITIVWHVSYFHLISVISAQ
uniref:Uncharacterized protein n=1 Tax=Arundo donax TaxID=35708 RepID=A0A0A9FVA3_ARUDO